MEFAYVTGFPFHLPADEQDGTIHLIGRDFTVKDARLSPHSLTKWIYAENAARVP